MHDDEIARLLQGDEIILVDQVAKKQAIISAMRAFDEKNAHARQGSAEPNRLILYFRNAADWIGGNLMKTTYALAGTTALAVLAVALLNTSALTGLMPHLAEKDSETLTHAPADATMQPLPEAAQENLNAVLKKPAASAQKEEAKIAIQLPAQPLEREPVSVPVPMAAGSAAPAMSQMDSASINQAPLPALPAPVAAKTKAVGRMVQLEAAPSGSVYAPPPTEPMPIATAHVEGNDQFQEIKPNPVKVTKEEPVSTFSIDVDTASYSFIRSALTNGYMPAKDVVRIEEMVNYFPYDYAKPKDKTQPFATQVAVFPTPWNKGTKLLHVGIQGYQLENAAKPHANLVFLIDTSGSMNEPNKLPLLVNSLKLLLNSLKPDDTISIVTYAGNAGVALEPTPASDKAKIVGILDHLQAGGGTAGADGIRTAYQLAETHFDKEGVNRVLLATDGDFNIGISDEKQLKEFIEHERDSGVFLSVLGFGTGNYHDNTMQTLAQNGNGNAAYIDNLNEARKVLVEEAGSTLFTIAKDVKIQVEFNPATVAEYRLIGYENRLLNREDFNNDKVDAGEIGAGHAVTAIYEITPVGSESVSVDELRYKGTKPEAKNTSDNGEYAFVKIRYKTPTGSKSTLVSTPVDAKVESDSIAKAPQESRFAAAVTGFGLLLRNDTALKSFTYEDDIALAQGAKGVDEFGYRAEFLNLVRLAKSITGSRPAQQ